MFPRLRSPSISPTGQQDGCRRGPTASSRPVQSAPDIIVGHESRLVALAAALIGDTVGLSGAEAKLVARTEAVEACLIGHARNQIIAGRDVLGTAFCVLRSVQERRHLHAGA